MSLQVCPPIKTSTLVTRWRMHHVYPLLERLERVQTFSERSLAQCSAVDGTLDFIFGDRLLMQGSCVG